MPEVIRGIRANSDRSITTPHRTTSNPSVPTATADPTASASDPQSTEASDRRHTVAFTGSHTADDNDATSPRRPSMGGHQSRRSLSYAQRRPSEVYHDSRAATKSEYRRRATTLQDF
jgi:hypothetical protein